MNVEFVTWLMALPEGWVAGLGRKAAFRCLGNACVPPQAVFALEELRLSLVSSWGYKANGETDVSLTDLVMDPGGT